MPASTDFARITASPPADLSFSKITQVRSFVLERPAGDLMVYAAATQPAADVTAQYLNHWHEIAVGGTAHAPLLIHEADRAAAERTRPIDRVFRSRALVDDDFELIPIPGHTAGATAFLWDSGEHRYLFTGDSLYLNGDRWRVAVLEESDRAAYIKSLKLIAGLDFDVLVPWAASKGGPYFSETTPAATAERIGEIVERLERGENA